MQKTFLSLLSAAVSLVLAAAPAPLSFEQLRCGGNLPERLAAIQSTKLVYQVTSEGEPAATLIIRTQRPSKMRVDVLAAEDTYTVCHSGSEGWGYSKKDQFFSLTAEETAEMHLDADFLPIPIDDKPAFAAPVAQGEEEADGVPCLRYETRPLIAKTMKIVLWVEKSTKLLRKVEAEDADSKTTTVFRDYKIIGGIRIAANIYVSDSDGFHKMSLQSATWNPVFAENLFTKPASAAGLNVAVTRTPATFRAPAVPPRKANPNEIAALQKKIAKLEILIKDDENKLAVVEKLIYADRSHAAALASVTTPVRYRSYWSRHGFIVNRSSSRSGKRTRHRMINKLNRETTKAMKEYNRINRELVRLRIQLSEAQAQLAAISAH